MAMSIITESWGKAAITALEDGERCTLVDEANFPQCLFLRVDIVFNFKDSCDIITSWRAVTEQLVSMTCFS